MERKNGYVRDFANSIVVVLSSSTSRRRWYGRKSSEKIIMQIMHRGNIVEYCLLLMGPAGWFRRHCVWRVCVCVFVCNVIPVVVAVAGQRLDDNFKRRVCSGPLQSAAAGLK